MRTKISCHRNENKHIKSLFGLKYLRWIAYSFWWRHFYFSSFFKVSLTKIYNFSRKSLSKINCQGWKWRALAKSLNARVPSKYLKVIFHLPGGPLAWKIYLPQQNSARHGQSGIHLFQTLIVRWWYVSSIDVIWIQLLLHYMY